VAVPRDFPSYVRLVNQVLRWRLQGYTGSLGITPHIRLQGYMMKQKIFGLCRPHNTVKQADLTPHQSQNIRE
jgi:hypothetical protein